MTGDIATSRTTDRRHQISSNPLDLLLLQDDLSTQMYLHRCCQYLADRTIRLVTEQYKFAPPDSLAIYRLTTVRSTTA